MPISHSKSFGLSPRSSSLSSPLGALLSVDGKQRMVQKRLDGDAQSITFRSRSLSTNLACILTRLPLCLMRVSSGWMAALMDACFPSLDHCPV